MPAGYPDLPFRSYTNPWGETGQAVAGLGGAVRDFGNERDRLQQAYQEMVEAKKVKILADQRADEDLRLKKDKEAQENKDRETDEAVIRNISAGLAGGGYTRQQELNEYSKLGRPAPVRFFTPEPEKPKEPTGDVASYVFYDKQEREAGRTPLTFNDWTKSGKKAGATNVITTIGGGPMSETAQKAAFELSSKADTMYEEVQNVQTFLDLVEDAKTGIMTPVTLPVKQAFKQVLGWELQEDVPLLETIRGYQNQYALKLRNPASGFGLTGNTSDRDVKFLKEAVAGIDKTPEANRAILTILLARQRREAEIAALKSDYLFETGSLAGWNQKRKEFIEKTPFFTDGEKAFLVSLKSKAKPFVSVPPNVFQAADAVYEGN